jgi:hypothetical protein
MMSVSDLVQSVTTMTQAFWVPASTSPRYWALGNHATCTAVGAAQQVGLAAFWYQGMLSSWYRLTIVHGRSGELRAARHEPYMHLLALGYPLTTSVAGIFMDVYHELNIGQACWVSEGPEDAPCLAEPTVRCQSVRLGYIFGAVPLVLILLTIAVNKWLIYRHVRRIARRSGRLSTVGQFSSAMATSQDAKIRAVAVQSFWYVIAFCTTYIWTIALRILESYGIYEDDDFSVAPVAGLVFAPVWLFQCPCLCPTPLLACAGALCQRDAAGRVAAGHFRGTAQ